MSVRMRGASLNHDCGMVCSVLMLAAEVVLELLKSNGLGVL